MDIDNADTDDATIVLTSTSFDAFREQSLDMARQFDHGDLDAETPQYLRSYANVSDLFAEFSPKRLELIEAVIEESAPSISALADRVGRDKSDVSRDVTELSSEGVLRTEEVSRGQKRVTCPYDSVELKIEFPRDGSSN